MTTSPEPQRNGVNGAEALTIPDHEAAEHLGVSVGTLQEKCRKKEWPHRRIGRRYRFAPADLAAILELTAVAPTQQAKAAQSWGRRGRSAS